MMAIVGINTKVDGIAAQVSTLESGLPAAAPNSYHCSKAADEDSIMEYE
jgi:hypothetical protein